MPPPSGDEPAFSSWSAVATAVNVSVADHTEMCVEECRKDCDAHGSGEEVKCFGKVGHGGLDQNCLIAEMQLILTRYMPNGHIFSIYKQQIFRDVD